MKNTAKKVASVIAIVLTLMLTACEKSEPEISDYSQIQDINGDSDIQREDDNPRTDDTVSETSDSASDLETESAEGMQIETYYLGTNDRILAYIPNCIKENEFGTVPMVLNLHWTGGTPEEQVSENGWTEVSEKEGFIMIAPFYGSYDSVYNHTDHFADIVRDAFARFPVIDKTRVYVTGFSNGGAAAVALTDQYPELFAAIAPQGWMIGMRNRTGKSGDYDMPFQIIQGSDEYTYATGSGAMAIMTDEQKALRDLMLFNEMSSEDFEPNYDETAFWGYAPDKTSTMEFNGKTWEISDYFKDGYNVPFGQLILVEDGIHWARQPHAQLAWDFMKHFRRSENGGVEQIDNL